MRQRQDVRHRRSFWNERDKLHMEEMSQPQNRGRASSFKRLYILALLQNFQLQVCYLWSYEAKLVL